MQTLKLINTKIQGIAQKLGIEEEMEFEAAHRGIWKLLRTRYLFLAYYVGVFSGLIVLLFIK